jgi:type I restriction enzyme S subunit
MHSGLVDQGQKFKKRVASLDTSQYKVVQRGQLVVGFPIDEGVLSIQRLYDAAIVSPAYGVWDVGSGINGRYLELYLRSPNALGYYATKLRGTTARRRSLPTEVFLDLPVPVPPLDEQRRISDILDHADALRAKRREGLSLLDGLTQSVFFNMFGDALSRSSEVPQGPFSKVVGSVTYGFTSPMEHVDDGIPIVTAKNVLDGSIDFNRVHYGTESQFSALTAKSKPQRGDILITKDGSIGRCAVVATDEPFCINQSVALVRPDITSVIPEYVIAYLMSPRVQAVLKGMGKGNALAHLQITELARMPIPHPSLESQHAFTRVIAMVRAVRQNQLDQLASLDELFASLQQRAFAGKL